MTLLMAFYGLAALMAWATVAYRIRDTLDSPNDRALRALVTMAAWFGVAFPLILGGPTVDTWHGLDGLTATVWHIAILFAGSRYAQFLLYSAWPPDQARTRLRPRRVFLAVCCVIIILAWMSADAAARAHDFRVTDASLPAAASQLVYLIGLGWIGGDGAILAGRAARSAVGDLRTGLHLVSVGSACGLAFVVAELVTAVLILSGSSMAVPDMVMVELVSLSIVGICGGAVYPGVRARMRELPRWLTRRRLHRQLWPLWDELRTEFPGAAFRIHRIPERTIVDALLLRRLRRRYYRRVIEIRDMLLDLRRWASPAAANRAVELATRAGLDEATTGIVARAAVLEQALQAKRDGSPGTHAADIDQALDIVDHLLLDDEARWLLRIQHARTQHRNLLEHATTGNTHC